MPNGGSFNLKFPIIKSVLYILDESDDFSVCARGAGSDNAAGNHRCGFLCADKILIFIWFPAIMRLIPN